MGGTLPGFTSTWTHRAASRPCTRTPTFSHFHTRVLAYSQYTKLYITHRAFTHPCTLVHSHTRAYTVTLTHVLTHSLALPCTVLHTCILVHAPTHTHSYSRSLILLLSHSHTQPTHTFSQFTPTLSHTCVLRNMYIYVLPHAHMCPHASLSHVTHTHAQESWEAPQEQNSPPICLGVRVV